MSREERKAHPVLASTFDCMAACVAAVMASDLVVGCAQGVAWLIGQVI